jgi:acetyltransferase-like isoleucine patch superfamily enzyme
VTRLDLLWWIGWIYLAGCIALPLALLPLAGPLPGAVIWLTCAPWTALAGAALVHRLLPAARTGTFRMFADEGSVQWALKSWAPTLYLTLFQPVFFLSPGFQRLSLKAFGARLGAGAVVTSRTSIREPHHVRIGAGAVVGEHVHFVCAYQPRPRLLVVGDITIGAGALIGGYAHITAGAVIGARVILEHGVGIGPGVQIGEDSRIGAGSMLYRRVRVGRGARIGRGCIIAGGTIVPDGAHVPDGAVLGACTGRERSSA